MKTIINIFNEVANANPDSIAIIHDKGNITYTDLYEYANSVANYLNSIGVSKDITVGTLFTSNVQSVKNMLGIFKSGGIYMPLDFNFSNKHLKQIFNRTLSNYLIFHEEDVDIVKKTLFDLNINIDFLLMLSKNGRITRFCLKDNVINKINDAILNKYNYPCVQQPSLEDSCYIFHTSGSTGDSKAILGKHASFSHYIQWEIKFLQVEKNYIFSQIASITFDASLKDILTPLCSGAVLAIPSSLQKQNISLLAEWLKETNVTVLQCVPSIFRLLTKQFESKNEKENLPHLKFIFLAGEMLYARDLQLWDKAVNSTAQIVNLYGATETTVLKTFNLIKEIPEKPAERIHVGIPIDDTEILIMSNGEIVNNGEIGEVYIATEYITKGYLDQALNQNVFIQNPNSSIPNIIYKTGDYGKINAEGNLEIIGRIDNQSKVNGVRIELSEIEQSMLNINGIDQAVAVIHQNTDMNNEIIVYYTGNKFQPEEIRNYLLFEVNARTIPSFFVHMATMPLNINGKVDKKRLPPLASLSEEKQPAIFENETESALGQIFSEILKVNNITRHDSFFNIGGSSLKAIQLISRIYKTFNVKIKLSDIFDKKSISSLAALIIAQAITTPYEYIESIKPAEHYDLSHAQKRLWILDHFDEIKNSYKISFSCIINGELSISYINEALLAVIKRHEILRTYFIEVDGTPKQKVIPFEELKLSGTIIKYIDCTKYDNVKDKAASIIANEEDNVFQLSSWPLLNICLLKTNENSHILYFSIHHIIFDEWSFGLFFKELLSNYDSLVKNAHLSALPNLKLQYKDYTYWINNEQIFEKPKKYWLNLIPKNIPVLNIPINSIRPKIKTYNGTTKQLIINKDLKKSIDSLCIKYDLSLFISLLSLVHILLHKYSKQDTIIIGAPLAGRIHSDLEEQLGCYVNMLPFLNTVLHQDTVSDFLLRVKKVALDAFEHQIYPFDLLVKDLKPARDISRSPLFDVVIVLQNFTGFDTFPSSNISIENINTFSKSSKFDLTFNFFETSENFLLSLEYNTNLFNENEIDFLLQSFESICSRSAQSPDTLIRDIDLITAEQKISTPVEIDNPVDNANTCLHHLIEKSSKIFPGNTALIYNDSVTTYAKLNEAANRLANYLLVHFKINPDDKIAILTEPNENIIVSIIAILKTGAAYVPIDKNYPTDRINYILHDIKPIALLINNEDFVCDEYPTVNIENDFSKFSLKDPNVFVDPSALAYVIYTSGTTGLSKGVFVSHSNVVSLLSNTEWGFNWLEKDVWSLFHNINFDFSVWELFMPLSMGAAVIIISNEVKKNPQKFADLITEQQITILNQVPSFFYQVMPYLLKKESLPLRYIIFGGDKLTYKKLEEFKLKFKNIHLINMYGITETTVHVTYKELSIEEIDLNENNIGKPIPSLGVHILDNRGNILPAEEIGEIAVYGKGVSRGYENLPELTQAKFITLHNNSRVYLSGDLGKINQNGEIIFLGRKDNQIKLRGYRIETGEIISIINTHFGITDVIIKVKDKDTDNESLVAFYVSDKEITASELRKTLKEKLPEYMVPTHLLRVELLPVTRNGKVDYNALDEIYSNAKTTNTLDATNTDIKSYLRELWREIFVTDEFTDESDFFEIGGHSLLAIQIMGRINKDFNKNIKLINIFEFPTISGLYNYLQTQEQATAMPDQKIEKAVQKTSYLATPFQQFIWAQEKIHNVNNPPSIYMWNINVNEEALKKALISLIKRHEILRTNFIFKESNVYQVINPADEINLNLQCIDLTDDPDQIDKLNTIHETERHIPFDLERGQTLKTILIKLSEKKSALLFKLNHIIYDGVSFEILRKELFYFYECYCSGNIPAIAPIEFQFKDFSEWYNKFLASPSMQKSITYWDNKMLKMQPLFANRFDRLNTGRSVPVNFHINAPEYKELKKLIQDNGSTLYFTLQAIVKCAIFCLWETEDITIGSPITLRDNPLLNNTLGPIMNVIPLRSIIDSDMQFNELLIQIKETSLEAFSNKYVPINYIKDHVITEKKQSMIGLGLTLQNQIDPKLAKFSNNQELLKEQENLGLISAPIWIIVVESISDIFITINYNNECFSKKEIYLFQKIFISVLNMVTGNPKILLNELRLHSFKKENSLEINIDI